jgi:enterochelin esterase family protein
MFRVNEGGSLDAKMPTMPMRLPIDAKGEFRFNEPPPYVAASRGDGMAVDNAGRYYVTSELGVQIFDPTGRPCGVLPKVNGDQPLTSCILAGSDHSTLYIAPGGSPPVIIVRGVPRKNATLSQTVTICVAVSG